MSMDDRTRRWLSEAGVGPGMRVLDVGTGAGPVALIAARLVGPTGSVVGLDRDGRRLVRARTAAAAAGLDNVTFVEGTVEDAELGAFDAVIGRRVLMHLPDPEGALRTLAEALVSGGLVLFEEMDFTLGSVGRPPLPLHEQVAAWTRTALDSAGVKRHMGYDLHPTLTAVGLTDVQVRMEAIVTTADQGHHPARVLKHLLPHMIRRGEVTADEVAIETLEERLLAERAAAAGTWIGDWVFAAWGRRPAP